MRLSSALVTWEPEFATRMVRNLWIRKRRPPAAHPFLAEKDGAAVAEPHEQADQHQDRGQHHQPDDGADQIEDTFGDHGYPRMDRTASITCVTSSPVMGGEDRQADGPGELGGGDGEVLRGVVVGVAPVGLEMEGDEVHRGAHLVFRHQLDEAVAGDWRIGVQPHHVQVPGVAGILGCVRRECDRQVREGRVEAAGDCRAAVGLSLARVSCTRPIAAAVSVRLYL